jgi:hypothetical protein
MVPILSQMIHLNITHPPTFLSLHWFLFLLATATFKSSGNNASSCFRQFRKENYHMFTCMDLTLHFV